MLTKVLKTWQKFLQKIAAKGSYCGILVGLLPALLLFYGGFIWLVAPRRQANLERENALAAVEAEIAKGRAIVAGEAAFKEEFARVVGLFYESLPLLPKETELANLMDGVQSAAREEKVTVTSLVAAREPQKSGNADKLYEREIPATVVGDYHQVLRFFARISQQTRILVIRDYTVASGAKEKNAKARPSYVTVQFSLLAFHAPPTAEFPALPPNLNVLLPQPAL